MNTRDTSSKNYRFFSRLPRLVVTSGILTLLVAGAVYATTTFSAKEVETGTVTTPAAVVADSSASGASAVKFSATQTRSCTNPQYTFTGTNDGVSLGGYYVHNNMWNATTGETMYICDYNNWYVDATGYSGTSVKTYPNVHLDMPNAFTTGVPFNNYSTISTTFAGQGPGAGIYDVAYDMWLNGVGAGNNTTEVMIWTEYITQVPLGSVTSTYSAGGVTYDIWNYHSGGVNVVSYVARGNQLSGTINLKALFSDGISKGYIPANPSLNQLGYGIEFCSTAGATRRFTVTDFSITLN